MREETESLEEAAQIRESVAENAPEDTIDILLGGSAPSKEEKHSKDRSNGVHGADKGLKD
jgi:methylmalonyl-CoA mutase cobalamin-binding subunit